MSSSSKPTARTRGRPHDEATAHFMSMDRALSQGNYGIAAKAQQSLAELGWEVRRRITYSQQLGPAGDGPGRGDQG
jgi:hypothetical protein